MAFACAHGPPANLIIQPVAGATDVVATVFLIGDAGEPAPDSEPVLRALAESIREAPGRVTTVFLGDNVYPAGLPGPGHPDRAEAERRLGAQVDAATVADAHVIFVPGNHDWAKGGADGWEAVRRSGAFIAARVPERARQLPDGGCPGPALADAGPLRVLALDTQWWLHGGTKPDSTSDCAAGTVADVMAAIGAALAADSRPTIVVAHHPIASGGKHGGHFGIKQHLFPLTELVPWLWLPLPVLGSLYPLSRQAGITSQDLTSASYRTLRDSLMSAFAPHPPLVYAAGHDHNLQVLRGSIVPHVLVSGTGHYPGGSLVHWTDSTAFASRRAGFMRLDATAAGHVRLGVVEVDGAGRVREAFASWLTGTP